LRNDYQQWLLDGTEQWLFDGRNVLCKTEIKSAKGERTFYTEEWKSADGHPMGHFGVNIPWVAFCSGTDLKREGRMIPLPAAVLRHCSDPFAYSDVTTTFDDGLGLPAAWICSVHRRFLLNRTRIGTRNIPSAIVTLRG
jgi:hypothetical protein